MSVATFPRPFPLTKFGEADFQIIRPQSGGVIESGRDFVIDRGQPKWKAELRTNRLTEADAGQWDAWRDSLRGAQRFCLMFDPAREYPIAYMPAGWGSLTRSGGGSFDGTGNITAIGNSGLASASRDTITFGGTLKLPVGLHLIARDYISLIESGRYSLHRVLDAAQLTADGSGVLTAWIEPEVPAGFTTAAVANLYRASGKFRLMEYSNPRQAAGAARPGQAAFSGMSVNL